ncbi:MFS transporter [Paenibacillus flagellatus]|uniref:MFS transporter n=1 Tax=Paenibacillus flagellatus TaxID=2211139 RepID=A0A2V5K9H9_9BACL|nr:MFS transporter [Paenibacillus flagellatus]PYI56131.1 MFS transporter [Paenibacillus flagellatus]
MIPTNEKNAADARPLSRLATFWFAVGAGLSVANVYFAQPLLDAIANELGIGRASVGIVVTVTQIGYAAGLLLLVPLGDLTNRRRLATGMMLLSAVGLLAAGAAPNAAVLLAGMAAVGLLAVVVQVLVAYAADLAGPADRGRTVGLVTGGVVTGILLARAAAGLLSDLAGWRAVYYASSMLTAVTACVLYRTMPARDRAKPRRSYPALLRSVLVLFAEEPVLRVRAVLCLLIFAAFSILWTSLVLPLSAPPHSLSETAIGAFGLAGAAGALAAARAGRLADRGYARHTTGAALALLLAAWLPIGMADRSLWALAAGIVVLDLAVQAVHVTNQSVILDVRPDARSRMTAGYMIFYSIGSAAGSIASTAVFARAGWSGVCLLGASVSAAALLFWWVNRRR